MDYSRSWPELRGRRVECDTLTGLLAAVRAGHGGTVVLRGEAGIGKTALLDFAVARASGFRVARVTGVRAESELPFAALHQLCGPYLDRLGDLPAPQRNALGTASGVYAGGTPDRFLLGLAVTNLLCDIASGAPLICVVDDVQWLDRASAQTLEFVARRLGDDPVAMVFAVRDTDGEPPLAGLPELLVRGLGSGDATDLLESALPWPVDARVRDRVLAESHGNPLALLELPRRLTAAELVFGGTAAGGTPAGANPTEQRFARQFGVLPRPARQLLLTAAAEPVGDVAVLWRAAERLGIGADAARAAESDGLVEWGRVVRFRHPLLRSAVYRSASPAERREVHSALADVTDPELDPDLRAWHRARAVVGTDETVAEELERTADRARVAGGLGAVATFLETAAVLTPDRERRVRRSLDAAEAKASAGAFEDASSLLAVAHAGPLDEAARARTELLRAQIAYNSAYREDALPLLVAAARRLEPLDGALARRTHLDALSAAVSSGRLASRPSAGLRAVARTARAAPAPGSPGRTDLLLRGLAVLYTDGYAASAPLLRRAVRAFGGADLTMDEALHGAWVAAVAAADLWDDAHWEVLTRRHLDVVRKAGALQVLPLALTNRVVVAVHMGDLAAADSLLAERQWVAGVSGGRPRLTPMPEAWLAAMRGQDQRAEQLIRDTLDEAVRRRLGATLTMAQTARAVLCNGRGRYGDALSAARDAATDPLELGPSKWALAELVEAGVHSGRTDVAVEAFEQLAALTRASGTDLARGIEAGMGALLHDDPGAEALHREAIDRLRRTRMRVELARAQLRYGEWLRRHGRRVDARAQLRTAHEALATMGVGAFADRAHRELVATGETVRRRTVDSDGELTPQEMHVAALAAEGLTNPEIAARLYLSPRTVEWHLRKVFTKRGVSTRRELRRSVD